MNVFLLYLLLCPPSVERPDCDTRNAVQVVLGPEIANEAQCGLASQEMLAATVKPRNGEYLKIVCGRRR